MTTTVSTTATERRRPPPRRRPTELRVRPTSRPSNWGIAGTVAIVLMLVASLYYGLGPRPEIASSLVLTPILLALSAPFLARAGRRETAFDLGGILYCALAVKCLSTLLRYLVVAEAYGNVADATAYDSHGTRLAASFRQLVFDVDVLAEIPGTGFIRYVTGLVYAVTGPNIFAGYLVFSFLAFWGLYFFYRAFVIAVPEGRHQRYAVLLFFWPSILFWPSSIGKEAWMILALGLTALGTARILTHRRGGFLLTAVGLLGATMVRPHVALVTFVALFAAYLLRPARRRGPHAGGAKVVGVLVLVVAGSAVIGGAESFLDVDDLGSGAGVTEALDRTQVQSETGGSTYAPVRVNSPVDLPAAAFTVLFRPLPHEAGSPLMMISAFEGLVLFGLVAASWRELWALPRRLPKVPYLAFALVFALAFIVAFAVVSNFGILARQRTQALPFVFVLAALAPVAAAPAQAATPARAAT